MNTRETAVSRKPGAGNDSGLKRDISVLHRCKEDDVFEEAFAWRAGVNGRALDAHKYGTEKEERHGLLKLRYPWHQDKAKE